MTFESILNQINRSIKTYSQRPAITIGEVTTTYFEFGQSVSAIRSLLKQHATSDAPVGVVLQDNYQTYAAFIALWLEGKAYVPINPLMPADRNCSIILQSDLSLLLNSGITIRNQFAQIEELTEVFTHDIFEEYDFSFTEVSESKCAYILFTSGTTGVPKGVPISRMNVASFMDGVEAMNMEFSHNDKFMQMFDLTFDLSVWSFLQPLCVGAQQFPIPHGEIKYMYAYELLEEHAITVALMVPSVLNFLRPYFEDLDFSTMRYSLFCGEALFADVAKEWLNIVPNARVFNVYGPTEATIFCSQFELVRGKEIPSSSGIVTIGDPLVHTKLIVLNDQLQETAPNERGELCIGGLQVTSGYVKNEALNTTSFFEYKNQLFYRSGDICYVNNDGFLMYSGRFDSQIKIQGFRIELSEIEHQARIAVDPSNVAAVAVSDANGLFEIHLFVESASIDEKSILNRLKELLPSYMVPKSVLPIEKFPLNVNGKTDRKALKALLSNPNIKIRRATVADADFLVDAIVNAEKSGTDRLSYSTIFNIEESEVRKILKEMILENEGYCELSIDPFLIAEIDGEPAAAVAAWVEGEDEIPSAIVKANLLFSFMPPTALESLRSVSQILDEVHIQRIEGALQLESIFTVAKYRGKGLAKLLIEHHIAEAKEKDNSINRAQIILSDMNESALKAYKKADFELTLHKTSNQPLVSNILPSSGNYCLEKNI